MSEIEPEEMHTWVRTALAAYEPFDARCRTSAATVLERLPDLAMPFSEDADPVHITASGFVVSHRGMVLLLHRRLEIWVQPGGHVEPGEFPPEAALREAEEETGLSCAHPVAGPRLVRVDVHPGPRGHTHLDFGYLLTSDGADPAPPAGERQVIVWFDPGAALERAEPALAAFLPGLFAAISD